jgi:hypothetical protein
MVSALMVSPKAGPGCAIDRQWARHRLLGSHLFAMTDGVWAHNQVADNGDIGLFAEGIDGNWIVANELSANPEAGMLSMAPAT